MRWLAVTAALLAAVVLASPSQAQDDGFQVIISEKNPVSSLAVSDVQLMFLKSTPLWPKGMKVRPVDLPIGSPIRAKFSLRVMGKPDHAVKAFWDHQVFAGESVPPPILATEEAAMAFVAENPGAIGYVSESASLPDGVRAIRLTD